MITKARSIYSMWDKKLSVLTNSDGYALPLREINYG
jgi:hypothetical protein